MHLQQGTRAVAAPLRATAFVIGMAVAGLSALPLFLAAVYRQCDEMQGYLFSPPLPPAAVAAMLRVQAHPFSTEPCHEAAA